MPVCVNPLRRVRLAASANTWQQTDRPLRADHVDLLPPQARRVRVWRGFARRLVSRGEPEVIPDERLRLIFACCHPALEPKSRVALTLRTVCGLTTPEIARAFLDAEPTMGQRIDLPPFVPRS